VRLGKHRTTIQRWLSSYRAGGMEELLFQKPRSGRPRGERVTFAMSIYTQLFLRLPIKSFK
jgi:hypothetical protein